MGSSCSSGQAHKDKDTTSQRSDESPSYQVCKNKPESDQKTAVAPTVQSGVVLEPATVESVARQAPSVQAPAPAVTVGGNKGPKPFRSIATSSYSTDSVSPNSPPGVLSPREVDKSRLPPLVRRLSDNSQHLLLGATAAARTNTRSRKIVIYICAADSQDCCIEKGVLHNKIYPSLREKAAGRGYELHIVDLHWKTGLEKQQDHEFPELCLEELARQSDTGYVIPVLFLSNSLGTPLLPKTIETQDFEMALSQADNKALLTKWYQLDSHAQPPCYRLQPIARHIPGFKEQCVEEKEKALAVWSSEIERILSVMLAAFPQELRDTYLTTVVEQEVHNTVLMSQEMARRCLWLCRVFTHTTEDPRVTLSPADAELKRRLETLQKALKNQLIEQHILRLTVKWQDGGLNTDNTEHAQYVAEVTASLTQRLSTTIDSIIEEDQNKTVIKSSQGIESELLQELMIQTHFTQRAAQCSVNREAILRELRSYVLGETSNGKTVVLHGVPGCGKTTLLARAAQCCHSWLPDCAVVVRTANISPQSSTLEQLLRTITIQCSILSTGSQVWLRHNVETYAEHLPKILETASLQRTIIIIVDGVDQLQEYGTVGVDWLPSPLPQNVKIILSISQDIALLQKMKTRLGISGVFIQIPDLDKAEAESILLSSVMEYNHSVNSHVQECVVTSVKACTLPLYVKVLAWQTSWCDTEHNIEPQGKVDQQLSVMLSQLEEKLGKEQVSLAIGLLSSAKYGLTDSEMLDLLAFTEVFHSKDTYVAWAPACLFWARLNKQLSPFLQWVPVQDTCVLQWRTATVRNHISQRYNANLPHARNMLIQYYKTEMSKQKEDKFSARHYTQAVKIGNGYNTRKLEELPFQEFHSSGTLWSYLEDHEWLYSKICGVSVYQVLEDIILEEKSSQHKEDLKWLRSFLEDNARSLAYDGRQLYSLLSDITSTVGLYKNWKSVIEKPPILSLVAVVREEITDEGNEILDTDKCLDMIIRLPKNPNFIVTIATEKEEISVWDVDTCVRVRTLKGVPQPINLEMIDDFRCVVLCKRELRTYNLNTGTLLTKLKGVMNQKMPYFGLHDSNHLVALSRNRMYVNLMNLETGDLVTTFKAGEDRFLNSLLVSGDGRVLVCGDETQKPFPLLVWNLASRKLLYDLRIPHHDFITTLAAITYEGHYVCCVAKEVDEPSPNFIVVYDLQSGTLFKKWKPSVNTVSLDISSKDGCVLSGLEDGKILVWDLITGNCRWRLSGHSAPVTSLRLDPCGGCFLSLDAECRDRSLRLWNLVAGELSAVWTPKRPITACEVTAGGKRVVLAMEGSRTLTTLQLSSDSPGPEPPPVYGLADNNGLTFDLTER
ncbi:NACHT and WD repeat domain-containing protein 2-like [Macrosteles quadrilineatus]|uniref:NACHT and WD repeat domain-containing protein 2-like n=1 Tax=Macrosteles quadrilineatus TaxID=74068 RepID=UPI0023E25C8D|nr:NACHT and WD repeat domain-containing protein 2-like [Macrosteles quadrilineatus]